MFTEPLEMSLLVVAGFVSGVFNAVAGGGSLLVFPALLATGMPPLVANVTNSVATGPGFIGAAFGQRADLTGQRRRVLTTSVVVAVGSIIGCTLLMVLPGSVFDVVVPILVGLAAVLMALQNRIKTWMGNQATDAPDRTVLLTVGIFFAAIYGGYFAGARSVIFIAILVLAATDTMRRLNALKNWLGLIGSAATIVALSLIAPVDWWAALTLMPTTLLGGYVGGKVSQRLPAAALRYTIVVIAAAVALYLGWDAFLR